MALIWICIVGVLALTGIQGAEIKLKSDSIYRLQNKEDTRVYLTAIGVQKANAESPIVVDTWRGAATQKWRLISIDPTLSLIQLQPTSDETHLLSIDAENSSLVAQSGLRWYNRIGISNSVHQWTVTAVEGGYVQLRNYKNGKCLQSFGNGKQVGISACVNSLRQQWLLEKL